MNGTGVVMFSHGSLEVKRFGLVTDLELVSRNETFVVHYVE